MNNIRTTLILFLLVAASAIAADSTSVITVSATLRARIETTDNATHLDSDDEKGWSYYRNRFGLMAQVYPASHLELGLRLTNEFRYYFFPTGKEFNFDEIVIDQLYLKVDSIAHRPLTAILGRQNITLGEGFVVADGTPLDGSRTAYFNGANFQYRFSDRSDLRLIYAYQQHQDDLLPIIDDREKAMSEQDEQAGIAYFTSSFGEVAYQLYVIQKHNAGTSSVPQADISCPGGRVQFSIAPKLTLTAEGALQFGTWGENNHSAQGGYAYLEYKTGLPNYYPGSFTIGGLFLSGDSYTTTDHEGWEPMFGRWPKWSESYVFALSREIAPSYWTNLSSIFGKTSVQMATDLTAGLEYHLLYAPKGNDPMTWYSEFPGGAGNRRGNLAVARVNYKASARLSGHAIFEYLVPNDFYFPGADNSAWMRMEMLLKL
ncbi:MAG: hypothetical protein NDJ18_01735 [candidate division Zixibacteria bacterium]|nr:hypothetical protein [candidate division Zixibacteria bacterium]